MGVQGQLGHAENPVHRRADFVAHIRQKIALGPARRFGVLFGPQQRFLGLLAFGDVLVNDERSGEFASDHHRRGKYFQINGRSVVASSARHQVQSLSPGHSFQPRRARRAIIAGIHNFQ